MSSCFDSLLVVLLRCKMNIKSNFSAVQGLQIEKIVI